MRGAQQPNVDLILGKDQLYDLFQQILGVKKFEHQIIFNALQVVVFCHIDMIDPFQLDNPDEQAAAIRREVTTREDMLKEMSRVKVYLIHK